MSRLYSLIFLISFACRAQLSFVDRETDLGNIKEAYEIKGDVVLKNESAKKISLLRADADKGVKVYASKKTLQPNDTALLVISFIPEKTGKFTRKILLVSSDTEKPYKLELSGSVNKLLMNDKLACFYFGSRKRNPVKLKENPVAIHVNNEPRDISNRIPDHESEPVVTFTPAISYTETPKTTIPEENKSELSLMDYKPNNILFLVDVSSSMRDSLKLPLMKIALFTLIDALRDVDKVTFITYADTTRIVSEAISGANKEELKKVVASLKARGLTKGNKAILKSQQIAQTHFIQEGNNQIIMATDGKFNFNAKDYKKWEENQRDKHIILTEIAFGDDDEALKNLQDIAKKCGGSFIRVKKKHGSEGKLLDEIKFRSKK